MVETRARQFALGGGSTDIRSEGLAALLEEMASDIRLIMLQARAALLHAEDFARCELHRAVQAEILVLPEGRRQVARAVYCVRAAEGASAVLSTALASERAGCKE